MASSKEEPVDFLKPDETQIPGQRYALISVVSPTSSQKNDMCGIKIKGVFETIEEAQLYAKKITQLDPLFDIFLVEMYKWLPVPPNSDLIENQNFQDEVLNTIVKTHVEEQYKAKQLAAQSAPPPPGMKANLPPPPPPGSTSLRSALPPPPPGARMGMLPPPPSAPSSRPIAQRVDDRAVDPRKRVRRE